LNMFNAGWRVSEHHARFKQHWTNIHIQLYCKIRFVSRSFQLQCVAVAVKWLIKIFKFHFLLDHARVYPCCWMIFCMRSIFILRVANADAISPAKHCSRLDFKRFVRDIRRILLSLKRSLCLVHYAITSERLISESGMDQFCPCHLCRRRYVAASSISSRWSC
jgi:hypothetical protein